MSDVLQNDRMIQMSNEKKVSVAAGLTFLVIVVLHFVVSKFADITYLVSAEEAKVLLDSGNANFFQKPLARIVADHPGMGFVNYIMLSQGMLLIPVLIFLLVVCLKKWVKLSDILHLKNMHWASWLLIPLIFILTEPLFMAVNALSQVLFRNHIGSVLTGTVTNLPFPAAVLLIALTPAIVEELTCRGMILGSLSHDHDPLPGILISGLTFGLMHMNINQFLYASLLGFLMATIVYSCGSIFASSLLHFVFNAFSVILLFLISKGLPRLMEILGNSGSGMDQESMQQALDQATSNPDTSSLVLAGMVFLIPGILGFGLALCLIYLLAKLNHRDQLIKDLFRKRTPEAQAALRASRKADRKEKGRYITLFLGIAWACAFVICILTEFGI
ncbi:MAG: CPBP family intramembrane metalloprotease [Lachnospiraceae bacterium]|nr:CPBP family intramembrane metalloprotease [Lachnospiraceae bacterium]